MSDRDIAIIGMDCVFPGSPDLETYWQNIVNGVDCISDNPGGRWEPIYYDPESTAVDRFYTQRGGFVDDYASFDPVAFGIMPIAALGAEPDQLLSLQVASRALADAGYADRSFPNEKTAVILGRGNYLGPGIMRLANMVRGAEQMMVTLRHLFPQLTEEQLSIIKADYQAQCGHYAADTAIGLVPNLTASRIANRLDLRGSAYTLDAACASSLLALDHACRQLATGESDMVLAGGVHLCHDPSFWSVFCQLGALSREQQIRPFDARADGLLIGEGIGMFVLKRLADAERDNDRIYAVVKGTGIASDGRDTSLMTPRVDGQVMALQRAWESSGLDPDTVGLIEAHGTATFAGDAAELETLARFFGPAKQGEERGGLGSVKSMIGHSMPAAGAAAIIKTALACYYGVLPPSLHCEEPQPAVERTRFRVIQKTEPWEASERRAAVNAFGFGGINAHAILEGHPSSPAVRSHGPRGAVRPNAGWLIKAAESQDSLLRALDEHQEALGQGSWRLAIYDPTPERVATARSIVASGQARHGRDGIFFSPNGLVSAGGRVAFLFPGMEGSLERNFDDLEAQFGAAMPEFDPASLEQRGVGLLWLSTMMLEATKQLGVQPDMLAGHSIGEWLGMVASGIIDQQGLATIVESLEPDSLDLADVPYVAVGAGAERVQEVIDGLPDIAVSHDNCTHQSIICGPQESLEPVLERLRDARLLYEVLPFRIGIHSSLFQGLTQPFTEHIEHLDLHPQHVQLWSATTCEPYPEDPEGVKDLFSRHLVEPVRFRELIQRLYDEGARIFLQVGQGSLVGFVDDTLAGKPHHAIAMNRREREGKEQLRWAAAEMFVEGIDVRLDFLDMLPRARRQGLKLELAVPLIESNIAPMQMDPMTDLAGETGTNPLANEFQATMRDLAAAQLEVSRALAATRPAGQTPAFAPPPAVAIPSPRQLRERSETLHLSVEVYPVLRDHSLFPQPTDWPYLADRAPTVPMTMSIQLMREAAEKLMPGLVSVAVQDVVARSWLLVEPPIDVTITAAELDDGRVHVSIGSYSECTVVLAEQYAAAPPADLAPLTNERPSPITAEEVYSERWMFHGPSYQGIETMSGMGDDGMRARLKVLPAKGAVLDAAGQLVGLFVFLESDVDRLAMPVRLNRVDFYGPQLADGELLECVVRLRNLGRQTVRGDIDIVHDGVLFARVHDWEDWRFHTEGGLFPVLRFPEANLLAEPQPQGFVAIKDLNWPISTLEFLAGRFLGAPEVAEIKTMQGQRALDWLYGRIAAKDATRALLFERGRAPMFPIEVRVTNDELGMPMVSGPFDEDIRVSIAHTQGIAVALAAEGVDVGIDIEPVEPRSEFFSSMAFTPDEVTLLPVRTDEWLTRLWCAKEAVGKARGTGLEGAPQKLKLSRVDGNRLLIENRWVETTLLDGYVVAWTGA